jgi:hypothetical protein
MSIESAVVGESASGGGGASTHGPLFRFLFVHEIDEYPAPGKRTGYLALAVLATIVLYYTYYTQTGVTPNILQNYHMTFSFYVWIVIISNLIGAGQRHHLRAAHYRPAGRGRGAPRLGGVGLRRGHLRPRPGGGGHPRRHPGHGA